MTATYDIWKMLAGIAIFLLGMSFMEDALKLLAGRKFKLFLKKQTANKLKAIAGGTIVTGLLQSSSVVNLLVLSLVGAGVIQMQNALAVMLGSNLGTTLDSWVVATLGFKYNIENFSFPLAGISGICLAFLKTETKIYRWSKFLLGLSFLFIGLGFIKEAMQELVNQTDLSQFNRSPLIVFFGLGILLTTIIQSSSATIALTLSALYAGAIPLPTAMAIVLGSEIGTTFKLFLASVKGITAKKRVALGNFLFNSITVTIMLFLLKPVHFLITETLQIENSLLALVFFQSLVNLASIILFYPVLHLLGRFLEKRFRSNVEESFYINKLTTADMDLATDGLEKESLHFIFHVLDFCLNNFEKPNDIPPGMLQENFGSKRIWEKYEFIKTYHGEIHQFYTQLQATSSGTQEAGRLDQLISGVRNGMYAAKNIRDAIHDIEMLRNSSNDTKYRFYKNAGDQLQIFSTAIIDLLLEKTRNNHLDKIIKLYKKMQDGYSATLAQLYKDGPFDKLSESEISTLLNFNREIYTAQKSLLFAIKDSVLSIGEAEQFDDMPGFIR